MAAVVLTLLVSLILAGTAWLTMGARLPLAEDEEINSVRNLLAYFGIALPFVFSVVFFLVERL